MSTDVTVLKSTRSTLQLFVTSTMYVKSTGTQAVQILDQPQSVNGYLSCSRASHLSQMWKLPG